MCGNIKRTTRYLIEFRFHGKANYEIKRLIYEINRKFRLKSKQTIPHITLAGPFHTNNEKRLISDFNRVCNKNPLMSFEIDGFSTFENTKVVFLNIRPSKELEEFRWNLSQTLKPYCRLKSFDYEKKFAFHATVAMKLPDEKFSKIKDYIKRKSKLNFKHVMVRTTLLKGSIILREYDFLLRRPLVRKLAKDKKVYTKTLNLLKAYFENKYNPNDFVGNSIRVKKKNFIEKLKDVFRKSKTFVASDRHLDHKNIIKYCNRPFLNIKEMNKILVNNWNNTISSKDTVYFLGDLACGRGSRSTDYWLKQLNGKIIFIRGNHDKSNRIKFYDSYILEYGGYEFFLCHKPEDVPIDWNEWVICGHHHNNKPQKYPFIDKKNKRINVSTELTKFRPLNMDDLIKLIKN